MYQLRLFLLPTRSHCFFLNVVSTTYLTGWPWDLSKVIYRKSFWKLTTNCLEFCPIALWISCSRGLFETSVQINKTYKSHCLPNGPALSTLSAEQEPLSNGMERDWPGKSEPSGERAMEHDGRLLWEFNVVTVAVMALDFDPILRSLLCLWTQSLASCFANQKRLSKSFPDWFRHPLRNLPERWNDPHFQDQGSGGWDNFYELSDSIQVKTSKHLQSALHSLLPRAGLFLQHSADWRNNSDNKSNHC